MCLFIAASKDLAQTSYFLATNRLYTDVSYRATEHEMQPVVTDVAWSVSVCVFTSVG